MSISNYEKARDLIGKIKNCSFEGVKTEALVLQAEHALGIQFPPSYRQFLLDLGCGDVNGVEVFGLIDDNFERSTVPNGIWLTLTERNSVHLNSVYVLIGDGGDGTYYALDTRNVDADGECPVVRLSVDLNQSGRIADSFGSYFLELVCAA